MALESSNEERILVILSRIERKLDKLDDIEKRLKAVEQDVQRVKNAVRSKA